MRRRPTRSLRQRPRSSATQRARISYPPVHAGVTADAPETYLAPIEIITGTLASGRPHPSVRRLVAEARRVVTSSEESAGCPGKPWVCPIYGTAAVNGSGTPFPTILR